MTVSCGAPPRAPAEARSSEVGATSAPEDRPLGVVGLPSDMAPLLTPDPVRDTAWQIDGACAEVGGDGFFPEKGESSRFAQRICHGCEVRSDCLEYALTTGQYFGVWGGLSERQLRAEAKRRAEVRVAVAA